MQAAVCKSLIGPDGIVIEDLPVPEPGPGEVRVRVKAIGINFLDTLITRGKYQHKPEPPFSPGAEIAGDIDKLGDGVERFSPGQRICAYLGWGGAREYVIVREEQLIPLPEAVSYEVAAGINVTYGTAIHGFKERGRLQAGETVAVLGAAGGAGLAAVEVAKRLGARVIAVASTPEKLDVCRQHGADLLLNYTTTDLKQGLRDLTGGRGVDVIYDCVGGDYSEPALRSIAPMGRFLVVGFAAGQIPRIPLNLVLLKSCDVVGVLMGQSALRNPRRHRENIETVLKWVAAGELRPHTHAALPLTDTGEAIRMLDRREATGKVIITV
jgi:NADPH2:quinone reductase